MNFPTSSFSSMTHMTPAPLFAFEPDQPAVDFSTRRTDSSGFSSLTRFATM